MSVLKALCGLTLLFGPMVTGIALGGDAVRDFIGSWRSTGPDQIILKLEAEGGVLSGAWSLPYDADGKPARLTVRLKGQRRGDQVMGTYQARVEANGQPERSAEMGGTVELSLINQGQGMRMNLWLEEENGEPQKIEFRRFEQESAESASPSGARHTANLRH